MQGHIRSVFKRHINSATSGILWRGSHLVLESEHLMGFLTDLKRWVLSIMEEAFRPGEQHE